MADKTDQQIFTPMFLTIEAYKLFSGNYSVRLDSPGVDRVAMATFERLVVVIWKKPVMTRWDIVTGFHPRVRNLTVWEHILGGEGSAISGHFLLQGVGICVKVNCLACE